MDEDTLTKYFFIGLVLVLSYLTFIIVKPFLAYLAMGIILTYLMYPIFETVNSKITNDALASGVMIVIILLVLIIPSFFITKTLVSQASGAIGMVQGGVVDNVSDFLAGFGIPEEQVNEIARDLINRLSNFVVDSASGIISSLPQLVLGLFILFFVIYYGFKDGKELYKTIEDHIPLKPKHRDKLMKDIHKVSHAVLYGQVLTAIVQGAVGGIGFLIFGLPNPVFWGFIMIIVSFLPVIGTPLIWVPAGLIEIAQANYVAGIGILIYGVVLIMNIDNVLKPKLISEKAQIHPVVIIVGVLGGLSVFGFSGIILGPLILGLLITMLRFYTEEKSFTL